MALNYDLTEFTEDVWKRIKKQYGIKSAGFFATADKNNIGPSLAAFHYSYQQFNKKPSKSELELFIRAGKRLQKGLDGIIGGNRAMPNASARDVTDLLDQLIAIRTQLNKLLKWAEKTVKDDAEIKALRTMADREILKFWKKQGIL